MNSSASALSPAQKRPYIVVLVLAILVNIAGIGIKYFTDDPSLYSMLARTMAQTNNFTDIIYHGKDWLDKPHFPFWMAALSFKVFGIGTIAYKLPALLFFLMSVLYTYKLARKFYDLETSLIAILILLTAQHVLMSNTDVRAEPYIMGLLMGAVYHFYKVKERFSFIDILLASLFTGCAVMTKGIYLLIPIGAAIIGDYLFKKDLKSLFHWKWLLAFILVCVFTLPEIYTLYIQFDLHPEKVVFGKTGISGIHWFLWDSQFGRFNNNSFIRNTHGSIFFFLHTLLWAFAPWMLLFYYALIRHIGKMIKGVKLPEYITISGSVIMLLIFSVSKFQLPFYTNILFPFFAIITAGFVREVFSSNKNLFFTIAQYSVVGLLIIAVVALHFVFAPERLNVFLPLCILLTGVGLYLYKNTASRQRTLFLLTCCTGLWVNAYLMSVVYPTLLIYKGDVHAAEYINEYHPGVEVIATFNVPNAFEFYTHQPVTFMGLDDAAKHPNALILINDDQKAQLQKSNTPFKLVSTFDNYPNENMTLPFIIKAKRMITLNHFFLVRMSSTAK
ncbi:glycosyltransferase family 39 protein [Mucilaginibacter sabulilitoris]|uniref:Glycosyltransferase family 39 protein n=1 Tax=Mucilaginibacter sabulilitoris TaxID=1173583 RepID=A0ABZ0TPU7_9SPHI|nr:glycosyltransferase family 39 protein [Mucilaginibacter sabulilitoris]WPU95171.1 glycosyltransferase family 39 protein [Mucilaginibacter sabulilitoris]